MTNDAWQYCFDHLTTFAACAGILTLGFDEVNNYRICMCLPVYKPRLLMVNFTLRCYAYNEERIYDELLLLYNEVIFSEPITSL